MELSNFVANVVSQVRRGVDAARNDSGAEARMPGAIEFEVDLSVDGLFLETYASKDSPRTRIRFAVDVASAEDEFAMFAPDGGEHEGG